MDAIIEIIRIGFANRVAHALVWVTNSLAQHEEWFTIPLDLIMDALYFDSSY